MRFVKHHTADRVRVDVALALPVKDRDRGWREYVRRWKWGTGTIKRYKRVHYSVGESNECSSSIQDIILPRKEATVSIHIVRLGYEYPNGPGTLGQSDTTVIVGMSHTWYACHAAVARLEMS